MTLQQLRELTARRAVSAISRLSSLPIEDATREFRANRPRASAESLLSALNLARRNPDDIALRRVSQTISALVWMLPEDELAKATIEPLELRLYEHYKESYGTLSRIYLAFRRFTLNPSINRLYSLLAEIAKALSTPCTVPESLDQRRKRLEDRMILYGTVLGVTFPLLFILSFIFNVLLLIGTVVVAASLWFLIRREGLEFRAVSIEHAWLGCRLDEADLAEIVLGPRGPQLLGGMQILSR